MLSFSKQTDYALLALSYLIGTESSRAVNTREIAEKYDIPVELLAKILQRLTRADLLHSTPGPTGGYRLARSPETISVGAIVNVIDGTPALAQCMRDGVPVCEQHDKCTIRTPLERINARILQMLELISLAEIAREAPDEQTISLFPNRHNAFAESRA